MPCYHLHLWRADEPPEFLGEISLPDVDAARAEAWRVAQELQSDLQTDDIFNGIAVELADETGQTVLAVPVSVAEVA
jgi:hypothetical protein